ncbi:peroxisomal membrane protein PEX13 [Phlebotomus argentipes]|uniref:peroxisomal membrane protein PEX13 n=1 Tax=Phlebotomus argentipes TaxID=94469 RepID=UPI00289363F9|nr:peroxisomal membrane protein PEX13 [Phlebotomus argentipes]XP_059622306.1 peroxisomal membrane protein PEX13 [Phlebotomus argentipes]
MDSEGHNLEAPTNFRNVMAPDSPINGRISTHMGRVPTSLPPPLPPRLQPQSQGFASSFSSPFGGYQNMYGYGAGSSFGGFGGYGGMGGYGSYGAYGAGLGAGGYGRYGGYHGYNLDAENRFIQMAEETSRPALQSIENLVAAFGNIASMLDSTFFAINSSFRAILGVTANVGKLRSLFAQFVSTFTLFRGLTWLWRKILYTFGVSKIPPNAASFGAAFEAASAQLENPSHGEKSSSGKTSAWPVLLFLGFILSAPYFIMKFLGVASTTSIEESKNPQQWTNYIPTRVLYDFEATSPQELSIQTGQVIRVAPKDVQNLHSLMNTGWALASVDGFRSGLVPINYLSRPGEAPPQPGAV